ncbi:MAG: DUF4336 domain-containing protein [bacterium]|nr:DUF4336 domain-containing protein [bacterium]
MLQAIGQDVWTHEASIHEIVLGIVRIPMRHRMTVMRLANGNVVLHSPTLLSAELQSAIALIGPVTAVIAPSWWHDLHLEDTLADYPHARLFVAPAILKAQRHLGAQALGEQPPQEWSKQIEQTPIAGIALHFDEFAFYHRASRSLILADLLANADAFSGRMQRLVRFASGQGCTFPRIFRPIIFDRQRFLASLDRILTWDFERIIVGHGPIVERDARRTFHDAFRWLESGR